MSDQEKSAISRHISPVDVTVHWYLSPISSFSAPLYLKIQKFTVNIVISLPLAKAYAIILGSESFTRWLVWGARDSTTDSTRELGKTAKFLHLHCLRVHKVKQQFYQIGGFECPHHLWLSTPLKLHSFLSKKKICRSPPPPKILGQKAKATTKVTLTSHHY